MLVAQPQDLSLLRTLELEEEQEETCGRRLAQPLHRHPLQQEWYRQRLVQQQFQTLL